MTRLLLPVLVAFVPAFAAGQSRPSATETARAINRALAARDAPIGVLVAETGGQNALIVDSSALPEQVARDVMSSAFQSGLPSPRIAAAPNLGYVLTETTAQSWPTLPAPPADQLVIPEAPDS